MKGYPDLSNIPQNCHVAGINGIVTKIFGDGSVMSSGETPGRGYPHHLPPTVASAAQYGGAPPVQRSLRHPQPPSHQTPPWPAHNPVGSMVGGFYGNPHLTGVRGGQWQAKPGNPLFGLPASLISQEVVAAATSPQSETIDLSSPRPEPLRNGEKSPVNGQLKEAAVSVIAPNPLREEIPAPPPPIREFPPVTALLRESLPASTPKEIPKEPPKDVLLPKESLVAQDAPPMSRDMALPKESASKEVSPQPKDTTHTTTPPSIPLAAPAPQIKVEPEIIESETIPQPLPPPPPTSATPPLEAKEVVTPPDVKDIIPVGDPVPPNKPEMPPDAASMGAKEPLPSDTTIKKEITDKDKTNDVDRVESLLENMFQGGEDTPIPQSVIVTNCTRQPALTDDKVVAILEDKSPVVDEVALKVAKPAPSTPVPSQPLDKIEEVKMEVENDIDNKEVTSCRLPPSSAKESSINLESTESNGGDETQAENKNPFTQVESELERMFAGIVEPVETNVPAKPAQSVEPAKKGKKKSAARPKARKISDAADKKKSKKRVSDGDRKAKKARFSGRDKITKEGSNDSSMTVQGKVRGPYVHIEGNRENPSYVFVVNSGGKEEEERDRGSDKPVTGVRRKVAAQHHTEGRVKGPGLYSSTLAARYNSNNVDGTWICVFCKQRPHCERGLGGEPAGDLYGPYMMNVIPGGSDLSSGTPTDKEVSEEQKRKGGGRQLSLRAAGVAQQFQNTFAKKTKQQRYSGGSEGDSVSGQQEVWVHEQCAVWAPGVIIVGSHLIGLEDAVSAASVTKCSHCGLTGAGLGCVVRNCPLRCHYGCALATNWDLNKDTFIAKCHVHAITAAQQPYVALEMLKIPA